MKTPLLRRLATAAMATLALALLSGCASVYTSEQRLDRWSVGENRDLVLVRGVHALKADGLDGLVCKNGGFQAAFKNHVDTEGRNLSFVLSQVCPSFTEWRSITGFTKSDFGKGSIGAAGFIKPGLEVEVEDIVEVSTLLNDQGQLLRPPLVTRVIRKNALKERDPTCYWDGQKGPLDSFATGGVVCPAEGWDWRNQKWAKK